MRELRVTSCGFGKTVEEVERRRFVKLKHCVLEPAARGLSVVELEEKPAATRIQQQRKFSSDADFIFSTKNSDCSREARFLNRKLHPWKFEKISHAYKAEFTQ
ncbi:hypothetical protein F511_37968 [Dorcoceras hygrometricum]|uniref:Uncharacterized protein n=1 Tax=Dorcoceras hygrometricum TaxID=472368 RepID=A0A2Z7DDF7_9LAMI|nr:hypothetical protein F511_37968 [Dorcoceras hygrometricum]